MKFTSYLLATCLLVSMNLFSMEKRASDSLNGQSSRQKRARLHNQQQTIIKQEPDDDEPAIEIKSEPQSALVAAGQSSTQHTVPLGAAANRDLSSTPSMAITDEMQLIQDTISGKIASARQLLQKPGIMVNAPLGRNKSGALIVAAQHGRKEIVELLLECPNIAINAQNEVGQTALVKAAQGGYQEIVELLIKRQGIDLNAARGKNALMYAACKAYQEILEMLLAQPSINVNAQDETGSTALIYASMREHKKSVKALLAEAEININLADNDGKTALMHAIEDNHFEVVKLLLAQQGIQIDNAALIAAVLSGNIKIVHLLLARPSIALNAQTRYGKTALMLAAREGHTEIVEALLERPGVSVNAQDNDGSTALMDAIDSKSNSTEIAQLLLAQEDIAVNTVTKRGWTPLMEAANRGNSEIVKALIAKGANINAANEHETVLMCAARLHHPDVVQILLERPDILLNTQTPREKLTPLMAAVKSGYKDIVALLLSKPNIDVNAQDCNGCTALMFAAETRYLDQLLAREITQLLLGKAGINVNLQNEKGETALILAAWHSKVDVVHQLIAAGASTEYAINLARRTSNERLLNCLTGCLSASAVFVHGQVLLLHSPITASQVPQPNPLKAVANYQRTLERVRQAQSAALAQRQGPLLPPSASHVPQQDPLEAIVRSILERPDLFERFDANSIITPLHFAAQYCHANLLRRLLERQAQPSVPDHNGDTPLHCAIKCYQHQAALTLIDAGANINFQNKLGQTPLMLAAQQGMRTVYDHLVTKGADQTLVDLQGRTWQNYIRENVRTGPIRNTEKVQVPL